MIEVAKNAKANRGTKVKSVERFNQELEVQGHLCEVPVTGDFNHVKGTFTITTRLSATHATYDDEELNLIIEKMAMGIADGFKWAMKLKWAHDNGKHSIGDNQPTLDFPGQTLGNEPVGEFVKIEEATA
jgi:hypothetical protein